MTIVRLGADVVSSNPAARQVFFIYLTIFDLPDFGHLYCTDEAQQAETVLSAVLSIYIYIYIYI